MKRNMFFALGVLFVFVFISCNSDTGNDLRYSIQVNNKTTSRSLGPSDTVELYIEQFVYREDANPRGLFLICPEPHINNAGWYSLTAELHVQNTINNGGYSTVEIGIRKMKINGTEYNFPNYDFPFWIPGGANFPCVTMGVGSFYSEYEENFSGLFMSDSVVSLKTVLTIDPDIIGTANSIGYDSNGLSIDPYKFIKVEGRINE